MGGGGLSGARAQPRGAGSAPPPALAPAPAPLCRLATACLLRCCHAHAPAVALTPRPRAHAHALPAAACAQIYDDEPYGKKSDMWSLGVLLHEVREAGAGGDGGRRWRQGCGGVGLQVARGAGAWRC